MSSRPHSRASPCATERETGSCVWAIVVAYRPDLNQSIVLLYRRPRLSRRWRCNDAFRLLRKIVFYSLLVSDAREQRTMIFRGLRDGLKKTAGPYREN